MPILIPAVLRVGVLLLRYESVTASAPESAHEFRGYVSRASATFISSSVSKPGYRAGETNLLV